MLKWWGSEDSDKGRGLREESEYIKRKSEYVLDELWDRLGEVFEG